MQTGAKPPDALEVLNRLRSHENRKPVDKLPETYSNISTERLQNLIVDWERQIQIHIELVSSAFKSSKCLDAQLVYIQPKNFLSFWTIALVFQYPKNF